MKKIRIFFLHQKSIKGFSLVELVVVITILAILGVISLIAYKSYTSNARDSQRATDMKSIEKGLKLYKVSSNVFPVPENKVDIDAGTAVIRYQGIVGDVTLGLASLPASGKDPKDDSYYTYITNAARTQAEIVGYYENQITSFQQIPWVEKAYASYPGSLMRYVGNNLGIVLNAASLPIQEDATLLAAGKIDLKTTATATTIKYSETDIFTSTWGDILSNIAGKDKIAAGFDDDLVGYWDMESIITVWWVKKLKDFSQYVNHGTSLNWVTSVSGKNGLASNFNDLNSYVSVNDVTKLKYTWWGLTVSLWIKPGSSDTTWAYVVSKPWNGWWAYNYSIYIGAAGNIQFGLMGATWFGMWSNINLPFDSWSHIAATVDASKNMKLYINGVLNNSWTHTINSWTPASWDANLPLSFWTLYPYGSWWVGANVFTLWGSIDEVRIYNRTLWATEVGLLYNLTK